MRNSLRIAKGATLFEIMLVIAIGGMILVAGIRYYKNAQQSQNINIMLNQISNITSAADRLSINSGSYAGVNSATMMSMNGGTKAMTTPYNAQYWFNSQSSTGYTCQVGNMPQYVCPVIN
jgi:Tfp pilus assembly protein PilE